MAQIKEIREKSIEELKGLLVTKKRELVEMKREHAAGDLTNPRKLTALRREIARINTVIGEGMTADTKENE